MKKRIYIPSCLAFIMLVECLSSCLKDDRAVDFSKSPTIVQLNLSGMAYFGQDAITESPDSATGLITRNFAVSTASLKIPTTITTVNLKVDNTLVAAYDQANPAISYLTMPSNAFIFTNTSVSIPGGQTTAIISVKFDKSKLDPSQSYMLPIKIAGTSGGYTISSNLGVHYYHFIGNDFAGGYLQDYTRTPAAGNYVGNPATLSPVTPTQLEGMSGYYTGTIRYEVSFTKNGTGNAATYSDFQVILNSDDVTNILNANGISVTSSPVIISAGYNPSTQYTYTQALKLFDFTYSVLGPSGARKVEDRFYKP